MVTILSNPFRQHNELHNKEKSTCVAPLNISATFEPTIQFLSPLRFGLSFNLVKVWPKIRSSTLTVHAWDRNINHNGVCRAVRWAGKNTFEAFEAVVFIRIPSLTSVASITCACHYWWMWWLLWSHPCPALQPWDGGINRAHKLEDFQDNSLFAVVAKNCCFSLNVGTMLK